MAKWIKSFLRIDTLALLISLVTVFTTFYISTHVFDHLPHIEDETAYVWEAQVIARNQISVPSPVCPQCFLVPFVIDYQGQRFAKYPPGWPAMLSLGERLGIPGLVNPVLAGACVWLVFLLVKKITDRGTAFIAALLNATSPLFLLNSGTLLSHTWSFFLTLTFITTWYDLTTPTTTSSSVMPAARWKTILPVVVAGLALGLIALTRPLTAVGIALPFFIHGSILLIKGLPHIKKRILVVGVIAATISSMVFLWQFAVTGNAVTNPYTLWWPYDTIGFGANIGLQTSGYWPSDALININNNLWVGNFDLFGWGAITWIFLIPGIIALSRRGKTWVVVSLLPCMALVYAFYWIGSWLFGPRYYLEAMISPILLTAAGFRWMAGSLKSHKKALMNSTRLNRLVIAAGKVLQTPRFVATVALLTLLIACSLLYYSPLRIGGMKGLYGVSQTALEPFQSKQASSLTPALVIVHPQKDWIEFGRLLSLSNPFLDTPFIFTLNQPDAENETLAAAFPGRILIHYYPDEPNRFYLHPRP